MSLSNLSSSNSNGAFLDYGEFRSGVYIQTSNQILYFTDENGNKVGYQWKGLLPHTTTTNDPNTDGGISDTAWCSIVGSGFIEKLSKEGIDLSWKAHLPTVEVSYNLPHKSLKIWEEGTISTDNDYWLYPGDGTVWNGVGVLGSIPDVPFKQIVPQNNVIEWSTIATEGQNQFTVPYEFTNISVFINGLLQNKSTGGYVVNGSTVTLNGSLKAGDVIHVVISNVHTTNIIYALQSDLNNYYTKTNLNSTSGSSYIGLTQGGTLDEAITYITPQMVNDTPYQTFGTALTSACNKAMANGIGEVRIPAGRYILDKTVDISMTKGLRLVFSPDAWILVKTPMTALKFFINKQHLNIEANGARIMADWGTTADGSQYAALDISDDTLDKSCSVTDLKVGFTGNKFGYGVYASCINLSTFHRCLLQANIGFYLESSLTNGATAHAMGVQIVNCEIYTTSDVIKIVNQGQLGCEGLLIEGGEFMGAGTGVRIVNEGLTSSSYLPPLFRIINNHFNCYQALYVKDVCRLVFSNNDVQSRHSSSKAVNGVLELGGVQGFQHNNNTYTSVLVGTGTNSDKTTPVYQFNSSLSNAYFSSTGNIYWLDGMTQPAYGFNGTTNVTIIESSNEILQSAASWTTSSYFQYFRPDNKTSIGNNGASVGLGRISSATLSSGVLTLSRAPAVGNTFTLPTSVVANTSSISQITCPSILVGKTISIQFSASEISFTHNTNLICPDGKSFKMWLPNVIQVYFLNTTQAIIMGVTGFNTISRNDISSAPTSKTSYGYAGAEYFDSTTKRLYKYIVGYGWVYTTMNDL
ncbi:putative structural protein [Klebsiella phage vB_KleM_RaK2]|uniref:Putative structural protein n=1 Tax=Klebsiella phage vB_KleM_RaK2 TaxID=1147094 RepID=H6X4Y9_9CAUD|nr:tail fiber protein [Klebsiella phage vB_KleM_RaK2]AFA44803.1 putative structural protein [Klebsiella phage vB_KleM_RaK2]